MKDLKIIDTFPENIHEFGMCGYKNIKHPGYQKKLEWTRDRFAEGMQYKMLVSEEKGAIGGIEYLPGENCWRPVEAEGYMFIHCIFIMKKDAKGRGYGQKMVEACIEDARLKNMNGVAVVTRKGSWMASKDVFLKMGFVVEDTAKPDFELLVLKFDSKSKNPAFKSGVKVVSEQYSNGLYIFTSAQCPYAWKATTEIAEASISDYKVKPEIIHLQSAAVAQQMPFPFGTFGIVINGKVVADHPVSQTRFRNIMNKSWEK